ncbi:Hypothetical_protein [Hexamita inflata]|uniref:Hypothetical_protein n=1 Tax=Hexamita inflata TaxID=28002 RepID=A0AA86PA14_9EUKA|nr:Hypothetical protein HINF_LOCUS21416 [Hexamita inflata]
MLQLLQIRQIQIIVRFNSDSKEKCSVLCLISLILFCFVGTPVADNLERWTSNTSFFCSFLDLVSKPVQLISLQNLLNKVAATEQVTTAKQNYLERVSMPYQIQKLKQPQNSY